MVNEFSNIHKILDYQINPDYQWSKDSICQLATSESWNIDELTEEGCCALKFLFYRLMVPKSHWEDCNYDKFLAIVKQKYKDRLNEEI